jgi:LysR family nitrogen assimilation transcriptional regulator
MNLRGLKYFVAVAQSRSFTRAAAKLRIAQPAVSRQIQNLELELGVALLVRTRAGVELTGAGDFLLKRIFPLLIELDQAKALLTRQADANVDDIVVGLTAGEGLAVAPTLIEKWGRKFPAAKLKIVEGLAPLIYSGLKDGSIDVGVAPEPLVFEGVWTKPLFEEPIIMIAPKEPNKAIGSVDDVDLSNIIEVLQLPHILPSSPNPLRGSIEAIAKGYGVTLNVVVELDSMSIIKDLVRRGTGFAFTTYAHLTNEIEHDLVRVIQMPGPEFKRNASLFGLSASENLHKNSSAVLFIEKLILDAVKAGLWPGATLRS